MGRWVGPAGRWPPAHRTGRRRLLVGAVLVSGMALAGCSSARSPEANGRLACQHVAASLRLYRAATTADPQLAAQDKRAALDQLRAALPLAAIAATSSGQWQALQTTLSESSRVPESKLVGALAAQCQGSGPASSPAGGDGT